MYLLLCNMLFLKISFEFNFFKKYFIYLFLERWERREKERERNIDVWLPLSSLMSPTGDLAQVCALTGNQTGNPLVPRPALNLLSHTSQA